MGRPLASGLARVITSGVMPYASCAHRRPVRPRPHWISSKSSSAPCWSHSARRPRRNSGVAAWMPPSPCTGSTMTAPVAGPMSAAAASKSLNGSKHTPGTSGANGSR